LLAARKSLDRFLERHANDHPFIIAFDASLMFAEGRNEAAHLRFKECKAVMPNDNSPDTSCVRLYCDFNLRLKTDSEWRKARQTALQLKPNPLTKAFLIFPTEKRMSELIRESGRPAAFVDAAMDLWPETCVRLPPSDIKKAPRFFPQRLSVFRRERTEWLRPPYSHLPSRTSSGMKVTC